MATIWTAYLPTSTATYEQLEPQTPLVNVGFGFQNFGDPTNGDNAGKAIHSRGFNDKATVWTKYAP